MSVLTNLTMDTIVVIVNFLERVRLVEDPALKAAGVNTFAGSIPVLSVLGNAHKVDIFELLSNIAIR